MKEAHDWDPPVGPEEAAEHAEEQLAERLGGELSHLIEVVRFGHETELFLAKNRVGQYLATKAEADLSEATRQLLDMDSLKGKTARDVFQKAKVAKAVLLWLDEAITAGRDAELAIQAQDSADDEA